MLNPGGNRQPRIVARRRPTSKRGLRWELAGLLCLAASILVTFVTVFVKDLPHTAQVGMPAHLDRLVQGVQHYYAVGRSPDETDVDPQGSRILHHCLPPSTHIPDPIPGPETLFQPRDPGRGNLWKALGFEQGLTLDYQYRVEVTGAPCEASDKHHNATVRVVAVANRDGDSHLATFF